MRGDTAPALVPNGPHVVFKGGEGRWGGGVVGLSPQGPGYWVNTLQVMAVQQLNGFDITAALCCSTGMQDNGRDSSCVSRAVIDEIDARRGRGSASRYANDHPHYVTIPELILILSFTFFIGRSYPPPSAVSMMLSSGLAIACSVLVTAACDGMEQQMSRMLF